MILEKSFYLYWLQFPPLLNKGVSGGASAKESACQYRRRKRCGFDPSVGKILWSRKWQPTPVFLPGKFHGQKSLAGYSPWGHKESDTTEHTYTHLLNKGKWPLHLSQRVVWKRWQPMKTKSKSFLKPYSAQNWNCDLTMVVLICHVSIALWNVQFVSKLPGDLNGGTDTHCRGYRCKWPFANNKVFYFWMKNSSLEVRGSPYAQPPCE